MRYVVSMVFALIGFGLATVFVSSQVADWVVSQQGFESPDDADAMHMMAYIAANIGGLLVGWVIGWIVTGVSRSEPRAD